MFPTIEKIGVRRVVSFDTSVAADAMTFVEYDATSDKYKPLSTGAIAGVLAESIAKDAVPATALIIFEDILFMSDFKTQPTADQIAECRKIGIYIDNRPAVKGG